MDNILASLGKMLGYAHEVPSPGEAKKLLLAFGLSREVEALFLDEPTNHITQE